MKELSIFQHPDFGPVRNEGIKGEPKTQARALANKNQWEDAYSPSKMDEVFSLLL